jgi:3-oxoacyl-[acyl-carrier-protein] synthase II
MYITGLSWITAGGTGRGNSNDPFDFSKGVIKDISGIDFPVDPCFRKGRLDRFSMLGLQAITNALYDAGLYEWDKKRDTGIVASTIYGCLKTDLDYYDSVTALNGNLPEPNLFTHTLSNIFLGYASILFGLTGPNYIYYEKSNDGRSALLSAVESISFGECDTMLAGICDIEPPPDPAEPEMPAPGSIFVVIEKNPSREKERFGRLSMDSMGNILLNNTVINSIGMCATECLKNRSLK